MLRERPSENPILPTAPATMAHSLVIETERLVLRRPVMADAKAIATLADDHRVVQHTRRMPHPYTRQDAEAFIAGIATRKTECVLLITHDGEAAGMIGLNFADGEAPEIGYWLRGFATEAARAVIDHAFEATPIKRMLAGARVINPASRRVLEKCGFQWTDVKLMRCLALGYSTPVDRFALERSVWISLKTWSNASRRKGAGKEALVTA